MFAVPNKFVYCLNSLKELLRAKLIECGWKDQLKAHCKGNSGQTTNTLCHQLSFWPSKSTRRRLYCLTVNLNKGWARRKYPWQLVLQENILAKNLETSLIWTLLNFREKYWNWFPRYSRRYSFLFWEGWRPYHRRLKTKIKENGADTAT